MNRLKHQDDVIVWEDGTWCYRCELWEMGHMSDDYTALFTETPEWVYFMENEA